MYLQLSSSSDGDGDESQLGENHVTIMPDLSETVKSVKVNEICFTWLCYFLIYNLGNQSVLKVLSLSISEWASVYHALPHTDTADHTYV